MSETVRAGPRSSAGRNRVPPVPARSTRTPLGWWRNPWRRPHILATATWMYLAWSLLPVLIAIAISFNSGRSNSIWRGFSTQWWWGHPSFDPSGALFVSPGLHAALIQSLRLSFLTMFIAVPLGVAFAIGISRWRGPALACANFLMLFSFVIPEIIIGISMFLFFTYLLKFVHLGTWRAAAFPGDLPGFVSGDHRPSAVAIDRQGIRGSGDGPRRFPDAGRPQGLATPAVPGDPGQLRPGVRRYDRRLHYRSVPVRWCQHRAAFSKDL